MSSLCLSNRPGTLTLALALALIGIAGAAGAYPGGTPEFQTDVAPFCAACHASRSTDVLPGIGDRATAELAENKHFALILAGEGAYADLSETDRKTLVEQLRALDTASSVALVAPAAVDPGQRFEVTVSVTGGAGPVVGVGLADSTHRWFARPAASAGWRIAGPPQITGSDGQPRVDWISKRPEGDRNISFVNVTNVSSNSAAQQWDSARVVFTLQAPDKPGKYPLVAFYLYGTETSTPLGYTTDALGNENPRGTYLGTSGRILSTPVKTIEVKAPMR